MWAHILPVGYGLLLNLAIIPPTALAANGRVVRSLSELKPSESSAVKWIKTWTVPNTRDAKGNPWTSNSLPSVLTDSEVYTDSINPSAWAAAIVTSFSIFEQILECGNFYNPAASLIDQKCDSFQYPATVPKRTDFPIEIFTYSFCQGGTNSPDSATDNYGEEHSCWCAYPCPGQLIGPNQICYGEAWQNGIFGMEQFHVASATDVANRAENIYHALGRTSYTYLDVLESTLNLAGFPAGTYEHGNVMRCFPQRKRVAADQLSSTCADLVSMWLTRNHLVGLTLAITDNVGWFWNERLNMVKLFANYYNT